MVRGCRQERARRCHRQGDEQGNGQDERAATERDPPLVQRREDLAILASQPCFSWTWKLPRACSSLRVRRPPSASSHTYAKLTNSSSIPHYSQRNHIKYCSSYMDLNLVQSSEFPSEAYWCMARGLRCRAAYAQPVRTAHTHRPPPPLQLPIYDSPQPCYLRFSYSTNTVGDRTPRSPAVESGGECSWQLGATSM